MDEKRKFNRWQVDNHNNAVVACEGKDRKAELIDISAGGMKLALSDHLDLGAIIYSKLDVLSDIKPFFVKGKIIRIEQKEKNFEAVVEFDQVSTVPLGN